MSAGPARPDVAVPAAVTELAGGAARPVWQNDAGGVVFEVTGGQRRFVKWAPAGSGIDLAAEAARLSWAVAFARVPELLDYGRDPAGSWIVTAALPGQMAVTARWKEEPARAVSAIGEGLRALHDAAPAGRCPFSWSAADRLAAASRRARAGLLDPAQWHPQHRPLGVSAALALLAEPPPPDRLVVCHGDERVRSQPTRGPRACAQAHARAPRIGWPVHRPGESGPKAAEQARPARGRF